MKRCKTWTLTDIASDTWLETFAVGGDHLPLGPAQNWSVRKRTLHGGLREGVDLIEVNNGALSFAVLPTRGMGLWRGRYHGLPLGWKAPVHGPVHQTVSSVHKPPVHQTVSSVRKPPEHVVRPTSSAIFTFAR